MTDEPSPTTRVIGAVRSRILSLVRSVGLGLRSPILVAVAWRLATRPFPIPGLVARPRVGRLVVLPKLGGTEDIMAALEGRGDLGFAVVALPRAEVKRVWRRLLGRHGAELGDVGYLTTDPDVESAKLRYRTFLRAVLRRYAWMIRANGFISANYAYFAERELAGAAEDVGLPFLVLHKESIRSPAQRPWFTRAYRERIGPFQGRSIAVYNDDERRSMIDAGVAPPDRIAVVGSPRIDPLHRLRRADPRSRPTDPVTVLFAIDPRAGTWTPFDDEVVTGAPRWDRLAAETEEAFVAAAREDPEHRYVLKVKLGREDLTLARLPRDLPPNLSVVTGGTGTELLSRADVAVAFNSTVIAEAIAAGAPIIVPTFAEATAARDWTLEVTGAAVEVHAAALIPTAIRNARAAGRRTVLDEDAEAVLERLVGDASGGASDRVLGWLTEALAPPSVISRRRAGRRRRSSPRSSAS